MSSADEVKMKIKFLDGTEKDFTTLAGADLRGAYLRWANLSWTNLEGANDESRGGESQRGRISRGRISLGRISQAPSLIVQAQPIRPSSANLSPITSKHTLNCMIRMNGVAGQQTRVAILPVVSLAGRATWAVDRGSCQYRQPQLCCSGSTARRCRTSMPPRVGKRS
jgi:Pentapeptide repeats (8 copies)